jgi:hypothetical protein
MGRPQKPIDAEAVAKLASMGLSAELIAAYMDVSHHTIERRFGPTLKRGREKRNARLQIKLVQEAMAGNTAVMIFLAKNWLGMTDRPEVVVNVQQNAALGGIPEDRLLQYRRLVTEFAETEAAAKQPGQLPAAQDDVAE